MIIRELLPSDMIGFLELYNVFGSMNIDNEQFKKIIVEREKIGIKTFVGVAIDEIIATHSIMIEPKFIHNGGYVAHFEDLIVHPDYRNHGVGEQMLKNSIEFCKDKGCYKAIYKCSEKMVKYYERTLSGYVNEISMRTDFA